MRENDSIRKSSRVFAHLDGITFEFLEKFTFDDANSDGKKKVK